MDQPLCMLLFKMAEKISIMWFRRDLRLKDNRALYEACKASKSVLPIFIFDPNILDKLKDKSDARVSFIHQTLKELEVIECHYGSPEEVFEKLFKKYDIEAIYNNKDYEPYALTRDKKIEKIAHKNKAYFYQFKDHCIFENLEVAKDDGKPYTVYTPYKNKWLKTLKKEHYKAFPSEKNLDALKKPSQKIPSLKSMGFSESDIPIPSQTVKKNILSSYDKNRDIPSLDATSKLGVHLRFGTVSPRKCVEIGLKLNAVWLSEIIWRDFFIQIMANFPHVPKGAFKPQYDDIEWRNNKKEFKAWCEGQTGYPIVDAGMRELNATGHMHNRVRMITASFLIKDLLIDWRWGEAYFAEKLLDFDLASNNGNWQWAAGSGCDAAPYFRIFNPTTQMKKFDPDMKYVSKWVPEWDTADYINPIVDHSMARDRTLAAYKKALGK